MSARENRLPASSKHTEIDMSDNNIMNSENEEVTSVDVNSILFSDDGWDEEPDMAQTKETSVLEALTSGRRPESRDEAYALAEAYSKMITGDETATPDTYMQNFRHVDDRLMVRPGYDKESGKYDIFAIWDQMVSDLPMIQARASGVEEFKKWGNAKMAQRFGTTPEMYALMSDADKIRLFSTDKDFFFRNNMEFVDVMGKDFDYGKMRTDVSLAAARTAAASSPSGAFNAAIAAQNAVYGDEDAKTDAERMRKAVELAEEKILSPNGEMYAMETRFMLAADPALRDLYNKMIASGEGREDGTIDEAQLVKILDEDMARDENIFDTRNDRFVRHKELIEILRGRDKRHGYTTTGGLVDRAITGIGNFGASLKDVGGGIYGKGNEAWEQAKEISDICSRDGADGYDRKKYAELLAGEIGYANRSEAYDEKSWESELVGVVADPVVTMFGFGAALKPLKISNAVRAVATGMKAVGHAGRGVSAAKWVGVAGNKTLKALNGIVGKTVVVGKDGKVVHGVKGVAMSFVPGTNKVRLGSVFTRNVQAKQRLADSIKRLENTLNAGPAKADVYSSLDVAKKNLMEMETRVFSSLGPNGSKYIESAIDIVDRLPGTYMVARAFYNEKQNETMYKLGKAMGNEFRPEMMDSESVKWANIVDAAGNALFVSGMSRLVDDIRTGKRVVDPKLRNSVETLYGGMHDYAMKGMTAEAWAADNALSLAVASQKFHTLKAGIEGGLMAGTETVVEKLWRNREIAKLEMQHNPDSKLTEADIAGDADYNVTNEDLERVWGQVKEFAIGSAAMGAPHAVKGFRAERAKYADVAKYFDNSSHRETILKAIGMAHRNGAKVVDFNQLGRDPKQHAKEIDAQIGKDKAAYDEVSADVSDYLLKVEDAIANTDGRATGTEEYAKIRDAARQKYGETFARVLDGITDGMGKRGRYESDSIGRERISRIIQKKAENKIGERAFAMAEKKDAMDVISNDLEGILKDWVGANVRRSYSEDGGVTFEIDVNGKKGAFGINFKAGDTTPLLTTLSDGTKVYYEGFATDAVKNIEAGEAGEYEISEYAKLDDQQKSELKSGIDVNGILSEHAKNSSQPGFEIVHVNADGTKSSSKRIRTGNVKGSFERASDITLDENGGVDEMSVGHEVGHAVWDILHNIGVMNAETDGKLRDIPEFSGMSDGELKEAFVERFVNDRLRKVAEGEFEAAGDEFAKQYSSIGEKVVGAFGKMADAVRKVASFRFDPDATSESYIEQFGKELVGEAEDAHKARVAAEEEEAARKKIAEDLAAESELREFYDQELVEKGLHEREVRDKQEEAKRIADEKRRNKESGHNLAIKLATEKKNFDAAIAETERAEMEKAKAEEEMVQRRIEEREAAARAEMVQAELNRKKYNKKRGDELAKALAVERDRIAKIQEERRQRLEEEDAKFERELDEAENDIVGNMFRTEDESTPEDIANARETALNRFREVMDRQWDKMLQESFIEAIIDSMEDGVGRIPGFESATAEEYAKAEGEMRAAAASRMSTGQTLTSKQAYAGLKTVAEKREMSKRLREAGYVYDRKTKCWISKTSNPVAHANIVHEEIVKKTELFQVVENRLVGKARAAYEKFWRGVTDEQLAKHAENAKSPLATAPNADAILAASGQIVEANKAASGAESKSRMAAGKDAVTKHIGRRRRDWRKVLQESTNSKIASIVSEIRSGIYTEQERAQMAILVHIGTGEPVGIVSKADGTINDGERLYPRSEFGIPPNTTLIPFTRSAFESMDFGRNYLVIGSKALSATRNGIASTMLREAKLGEFRKAWEAKHPSRKFSFKNLGNADKLKFKIATGWELGDDGMWMYEVPNMDDSVIQEMIDRLSVGKTFTMKEMNAKWMNSLMKLYPKLKDCKVIAFDPGEYRMTSDDEGAYDEADNILYISNERLRSLDNAKNTVIHELQHFVQHREGFAAGSDPSNFKFAVELRRDQDPEQHAIKEASSILRMDDDFEYAEDLGVNPSGGILGALEYAYEKLDDLAADADYLGIDKDVLSKRKKDLNGILSKIKEDPYSYLTEKELYATAYGEVVARASAIRDRSQIRSSLISESFDRVLSHLKMGDEPDIMDEIANEGANGDGRELSRKYEPSGVEGHEKANGEEEVLHVRGGVREEELHEDTPRETSDGRGAYGERQGEVRERPGFGDVETRGEETGEIPSFYDNDVPGLRGNVQGFSRGGNVPERLYTVVSDRGIRRIAGEALARSIRDSVRANTGYSFDVNGISFRGVRSASGANNLYFADGPKPKIPQGFLKLARTKRFRIDDVIGKFNDKDETLRSAMPEVAASPIRLLKGRVTRTVGAENNPRTVEMGVDYVDSEKEIELPAFRGDDFILVNGNGEVVVDEKRWDAKKAPEQFARAVVDLVRKYSGDEGWEPGVKTSEAALDKAVTGGGRQKRSGSSLTYWLLDDRLFGQIKVGDEFIRGVGPIVEKALREHFKNVGDEKFASVCKEVADTIRKEFESVSNYFSAQLETDAIASAYGKASDMVDAYEKNRDKISGGLKSMYSFNTDSGNYTRRNVEFWNDVIMKAVDVTLFGSHSGRKTIRSEFRKAILDRIHDDIVANITAVIGNGGGRAPRTLSEARDSGVPLDVKRVKPQREPLEAPSVAENSSLDAADKSQIATEGATEGQISDVRNIADYAAGREEMLNSMGGDGDDAVGAYENGAVTQTVGAGTVVGEFAYNDEVGYWKGFVARDRKWQANKQNVADGIRKILGSLRSRMEKCADFAKLQTDIANEIDDLVAKNCDSDSRTVRRYMKDEVMGMMSGGQDRMYGVVPQRSTPASLVAEAAAARLVRELSKVGAKAGYDERVKRWIGEQAARIGVKDVDSFVRESYDDAIAMARMVKSSIDKDASEAVIAAGVRRAAAARRLTNDMMRSFTKGYDIGQFGENASRRAIADADRERRTQIKNAKGVSIGELNSMIGFDTVGGVLGLGRGEEATAGAAKFSADFVRGFADYIRRHDERFIGMSDSDIMDNLVARKELAVTASNWIKAVAKTLPYGKTRDEAKTAAASLAAGLSTWNSGATFMNVQRIIENQARKFANALQSFSVDDAISTIEKTIDGHIGSGMPLDEREHARNLSMSPQEQQFWKFAKESMRMTKEAVDKEIDRLEERLSEISGKAEKFARDNGGDADDISSRVAEYREIVRKINAYRKYGALKGRSFAEVSDVINNQIAKDISGAVAAWEAKHADRANELIMKRDALVRDLTNARKNKKGEFVDRTDKGNFVAFSVADLFRRLQIDLMSDTESYEEIENLRRDASIANIDKVTFISEWETKMRDAAKRIFGKGFESLVREWMVVNPDYDKFSRTGWSVKDDAQEVEIMVKGVKKRVRLATDGGVATNLPTHLSKANLAYIWACGQQDDMIANNVIWGRDAAYYAEIERIIGAEGMKMASWMTSAFGEIRDRLTPVSVDITGMEVLSPDVNYFPLDFVQDKVSTDERRYNSSPFPRFLTSRRNHDYSRLDETSDIFRSFENKIDESGHYLGFARMIDETGVTFRDRKVQTAYEQLMGKKAKDDMYAQMADMLNGGRRNCDSLLNGARNFVTATSLFGNVASAMKQLEGIGGWSVEMGLVPWAKGLVVNPITSAEVRNGFRELSEAGLFVTRSNEGISEAMVSLMNYADGMPIGPFSRTRKWYLKHGMDITKFVDKISSMSMAAQYYVGRKNFYLSNHLDEATAKRNALADTDYAIQTTQQSGRPEFMHTAQRGGTFGKMLTQFSGPAFVRWGIEIENWHRAMILGDKGAWRKLASRMISLHVICPSLLTAAGFAGSWMFDKDDDENLVQDTERELMMGIVTGPMSGWFIWGSVFQSIADRVAAGGSKSRYGGSRMSPPVMSKLSSLASATSKIFEDISKAHPWSEFDNSMTDNIVEDTIKILNMTIPITRTANIAKRLTDD